MNRTWGLTMTHTTRHLTTALMIGFAALWSATATPLQAAVSVGDHPQINFKATDGTQVTSESLRGRLVIVDFWATWCGPCVKAVPHMLKLNQQYSARGVQIIGISRDSDRRALERFVSNKRMTWPQFFDKNETAKMSRAWGVSGIPSIFILSPQGEVLWIGHPARMDKPFAEALKNHPPTPPSASKDGSSSATQARDDAVEALQQARALVNTDDFAQMLALIAGVSDDVLTDRRVLGNARVLLARLELKPESTDALAVAKEANPDAAAKFDALTQAVNNATPGTDTNNAQRPAVHPKLVASKLAQADKAREGDKHYRAFTLYNWLLDRAGETETGHTAAQRIAEYEADEEKMAVIQSAQAEQRAKSLLSLAKNYEAAGNHEQAKATYEQVLAEYEDATECCALAREALAKLE